MVSRDVGGAREARRRSGGAGGLPSQVPSQCTKKRNWTLLPELGFIGGRHLCLRLQSSQSASELVLVF